MFDQITFHTPRKAQELVDHLNADSDDWTYEVEMRGQWAVIAVFDETGYRLGEL